MISINRQRLLADLQELRQIGAVDGGVERLAFSADDVRGREWVLARLEATALEAHIDGIGNVYGRWPGVERALLVGSHTDTVPRGGWLDGALGVVAALEVARALRDVSPETSVGVDVVSFADEEGTFQGTLGSMVFCGGEIPAAQVSAAGVSLADALAAAGWSDRPLASVDPARHRAYLELHVEQGPRLEAASIPIGVVTGIVSMRRVAVAFTGRADHAGTTPMALRRDAGAAAIRFADRILDAFAERAAPDTVWNIGRSSFNPGAGNVVPSRAELFVEYRDTSNELLDELDELVERVAREEATEHDTPVELRPVVWLSGIKMADAVVGELEAAARDLELASLRLPSGAGHDAMVLGRHVPAGMLFVPSIGGRSHDPAENTSEADIVAGVRVLARAVERLLAREA